MQKMLTQIDMTQVTIYIIHKACTRLVLVIGVDDIRPLKYPPSVVRIRVGQMGCWRSDRLHSASLPSHGQASSPRLLQGSSGLHHGVFPQSHVRNRI